MLVAKLLLFVACAESLMAVASGQTLEPDPDRMFITPLKWERIGGAPRSVKERWAAGTLAIFYLEGVYAEVSASFLRMGPKEPIGLNLNEGFVMRLGSWSRTDDDQLIRIEARDVVRNKIIRALKCEAIAGKKVCAPEPEGALPGPVKYSTCRLERPSTVHIADTIVCTGGFMVSHVQGRLDLVDFPNIVRSYVAQHGKYEEAK
jgi:hypothetical protein